MTQIGIINSSTNPLPAYETPGSAGMDLRAYLPDGPVTLRPLQRAMIPTGIRLEIPDGWECQIRPRSGLAARHGISVLNSPGTVDSDYRGEVKVILVNISDTDFTIEDGERICQMVFAPAPQVGLVPKVSLSETSRGEGGFGHSGRF